VPGFLVRLVINMLGLLLARELVAGVEISGFGTFIAAALLLGVVNSLVRPVAILLTLPFTILTLGLFLLVINAAMLGIVAWLLQGFVLSGWGAAFFGALIVSLTSWVGSWYIGPRAKVEILVIEEMRGR
jgi:putative membrane protein